MPSAESRESPSRTGWKSTAAPARHTQGQQPAGGDGPPRPNIVFVLTDQWRGCATGYEGDPNVRTPNLDALASESVNFRNAVSVCPVCTPYRAALLTGRYPLSTGMFLNDLYLPAEELCMAEVFNRAGYDTGYVGKWHLDGHGRAAFIPPERHQGFDYWKVAECDHNYPHSHYYSGNSPTMRHWDGYDAFAQTADAKEYMRDRARGDRPFLLVVSYGAPHFPHQTAPRELQDIYPPEGITLRPNVPENMRQNAQTEAQGYYAHCTALDRCVGDLLETLEELGIADNTVFIFTSDHGEALGSQGRGPCSKQGPWDEIILVPFLMRYPAIAGRQGRVARIPINAPDILPTLLSLAGIDIPKSVEGDDLSQLILRENANDDRAARSRSVATFGGYHLGQEFRGVRTARYTYVRSLAGPWLMYDNEADPYQMVNLVNRPDRADLQEDLEDRLQKEQRRTRDRFLPREQHIAQWRYDVDETGCIPYVGEITPQSPTQPQSQWNVQT